MLKFSDWILSRESSATTRAREAWARYNAYPPSAGFTSHSSGPAFVWDKMKKEFPDILVPKSKKKPKGKKKKKNKI